MESLLVPVRFYDHLRWSPAIAADAPCTLQLAEAGCSAPRLSSSADNLVLRAAQRLAESAGIEPHGTFQLFKRIPAQAGMGGGSSDAAAALVLANAAWGLSFSRAKLTELAADVGSDVPFFLANGPAVCRGRGEIVEKITGLPPLHFVVAKPNVGLPTAEVFAQWKQTQSFATASIAQLLDRLRQGQLERASQWMVNQLQAVAMQLKPAVSRLLEQIQRLNPIACLMTGSGTACFGLAHSAAHARHMARRLSGMVEGQIFAVSSC